MTQYAIAVEKSANGKTGPVSTTYAAQASCPWYCRFFKAGCYANYGMVGIHTARLNKQSGGKEARVDPRVIARYEAKAIDGLSGKRPMRLHVVGDAKTNGAAKILAAAVERYKARGVYFAPALLSLASEVWTYTHAWRKVLRSSWGKVSVLASCESIADAEQAMSLGYAAALVVDRHPIDGKAWKDDGITFIPCPAQTREDVTCDECQLCWKDQWLLAEQRVITFEAHGSGQKHVKQQLIQIH